MHYKGNQLTAALGVPLARRLRAALPAAWTDRPIYIRFHDQCPVVDSLDEGGVAGQTRVWLWQPEGAKLTLASAARGNGATASAARPARGQWALVGNAYWDGRAYRWYLYVVAPGHRPAAPDAPVRGL